MHVLNDIHYFSPHGRDAPLQVLETFVLFGRHARRCNLKNPYFLNFCTGSFGKTILFVILNTLLLPEHS
jgi:hypothetical protein